LEDGCAIEIPCLDVVPTKNHGEKDLRIAIINRSPDTVVEATLDTGTAHQFSDGIMYTLNGPEKDSYNDIDNPMTVSVDKNRIAAGAHGKFTVEVLPHSVNVQILS